MKKRILALLLAAMITASMAACQSSTGDRPDPTGDPTEGSQNLPTDSTPTQAPDVVTWTTTNDTVYVSAQTTSLVLIGVDNPSSVASVGAATKLHRVKYGSNGKSVVEYNGVQYYADTVSLTTEDLLGEGMTPCTPVTMYIKDNGVGVRKYATKNSQRIALLNLNDTITVVAKGDAWVKIQYDATSQYFVNAAYVSETEVKDVNDINNYPAFTDVEEEFVLYVAEGQLKLRKCPSVESEELTTMVYGSKMLVKASAEVDGSIWYKVVYTAKGTEVGQGDMVYTGYVAKSKYVSTTNPAPDLSEMMNIYPSFTALDTAKTMYVSTEADTLYVRKTPERPEDNSNLAEFVFVQKSAVKVVATGNQNDIFWAMVEVEGKFYFVGHSYLTEDPTGKPTPMTLEQLLLTYPAFKQNETAKTVYAKGVTNCNPKPAEHSAEDISVKLNAGEAVSVIAEGLHGGKTWYVFQKNGEYFFAGAEMFSEQNPAG